jgi:hypothetical protein
MWAGGVRAGSSLYDWLHNPRLLLWVGVSVPRHHFNRLMMAMSRHHHHHHRREQRKGDEWPLTPGTSCRHHRQVAFCQVATFVRAGLI